MNGQVSLLNKKLSEAPQEKKLPSYKVYIEDDNGTSYSTKLHNDVETVNDAIMQAVSNFNHNLNAHLPQESALY
jgi:hypothetical protein